MKYIYLLISIILIINNYIQVECVEWSDCGDPSDSFKITSLSFEPDTPVSGQDLIITVNGVLSEEITEATAYTSITFDSIPIIRSKGYLCKTMGVQCPISTGNKTTTINQSIPSNMPAGRYYVNFGLYSGNNQIVCVDVNLNITQNNYY